MSKISRRNFIKGAGVPALSVAAAGMLTGCGSSAPEMVDVTVKYTKLNTLDLGYRVFPVARNVTLKSTSRMEVTTRPPLGHACLRPGVLQGLQATHAGPSGRYGPFTRRLVLSA